MSVTDPRKKAPILRLVDARGLREDAGEPLNTAGKERAIAVAYRPTRWPEEPVYVVIRRDGDGEQRLLEPVCTVIPVSRDRLSVAELGRRHRGKQGQEHAFQEPLTDLGLHPPPCRSPAAHQGFYLGGQIAQLLLRLLPDQALPAAARQHGLRPLIRYCVGSVGRLTRSARRLRLLCSRSNLHLHWLLPAGSRREPGWARRGRSRGEPSGRGPPRSPRGARCAPSRGRSGCEAGAGRLRGGPGRSATG